MQNHPEEEKSLEKGQANQTESTAEKASDSTAVKDQEKNAEHQENLKIELVKYQSFINAISNSRSIARAAGLIALVVCLIFGGLLLLAISLKRIYPYSDIQTNVQGATTIRDEDKDVTYWLFNTADLWANSGIEVKKGDVLNIRASGMSHTAIHSLVKDASENRVLGNKWIGSDGVESRDNPRDILRNKWRIVPSKPQDALVMRVVNEETKGAEGGDSSFDASSIYLIGKGREGLQINEDGYLQFAINDIILTDEIIYKMLHDHARMLVTKYRNGYLSEFEKKYPEEYTEEGYVNLLEDGIVADLYARYNDSEENPESYKFGPSPGKNNEGPVNTWKENEMTYYKENKYRNVWFDDNIGSFLIVIERKNR